MAEENRDELEVNVQALLFACLQKWWAIVLSTMVAVGLTAAYTIFCITPMYTASFTGYVNNISVQEEINYVSASALSAAQQLVDTYIEIIRSERVLNKAAEESGLNVSAGQIRGMLSASQIEGTTLFKVSITHPDPKTATRIANAVAEVMPDELVEFVKGSYTRVVDYAKQPGAPSSPNLTRNCMMGGALGAALAIFIVIISALMDGRIRSAEDLERWFGLTVLGQIPVFHADEVKQAGEYGKKKKAAADGKNGKEGAGA